MLKMIPLLNVRLYTTVAIYLVLLTYKIGSFELNNGNEIDMDVLSIADRYLENFLPLNE